MNSIYIHIPFCDTLCNYCDFCKVINYEKFTNSYLDMLGNEVEMYYGNQIIDTLYIGGGTPSALSLAEIEKLFVIVDKLNLSKECEITFECNFENTTKEKLDLLKKKRVNRLSFGIQTFNNRLLRIINRCHTHIQVNDILSYAKQIGFNNINVDLIFNLPTQTLAELKNDIDLFLKLDVTHIALYSLTIETKSVFGFNNLCVDEDLGAAMYSFIISELKTKGFNHYETSNFCKPGFESKHNMCYWNYNDYQGFGLGAHSLFGSKRYINTSSINEYLKENFKQEYDISEDCEFEYIMMNLRKTKGLNLEDFKKRYNKDLLISYDISKILDDLVEIDNNYLRLTSKGIMFANTVYLYFIGDDDG